MRILIVEDERKIAQAIKRGLEQESYAVDVAYDGDEGLSTALATEYDVVILDRMLPGEKDGIAICKVLRTEGNQVPVLMLTAKDAVRDRVVGLDAGADDYLVKPFAFEELLARIRALLRRPVATDQTVLSVADVEMDTSNFSVKRAGKPVKLSRREYALLEYLLRNPGRVLTKDNIIEHVWDYDADVLPNTVEVYMGYLRAKLQASLSDKSSSPQFLIETVRGFGYKLEVV